MAPRDNPYGAFNFMVKLGNGGNEDQIVGGFSDVSGLGNEVKYSEYRNGNDPENHVRKVPNVNSTDDVAPAYQRALLALKLRHLPVV